MPIIIITHLTLNELPNSYRVSDGVMINAKLLLLRTHRRSTPRGKIEILYIIILLFSHNG